MGGQTPGRIVVVGGINMDLVVRSPRHPRPGETLIGAAFHTFPGGKGANQAVAAARLGAPVAMIGRVGADAFGEAMLASLHAAGVTTEHIGRDAGAATGVALITVDAAGENTIVVAQGANARVSAADVNAAEPAIRDAAVLLAQLECPLPAVERAVELARRHGVRVVLNAAPAQSLAAELLGAVDDLIVNETELAVLSRLDLIDSPEPGARRLLELGVGRVVATLGASGALLVEPTGARALLGHRVPVVDTTAAGDAFCGAYGVALARGAGAAEAVAWGNRAGALAVTRAGAQPSLPTLAELERFSAEPSG